MCAAAQAGANVYVIDVGIDTAEPSPGLSTCVLLEVVAILLQLRNESPSGRKVAFGRHMLYAGLAKNGVTLFGVGELGMANTTRQRQ